MHQGPRTHKHSRHSSLKEGMTRGNTSSALLSLLFLWLDWVFVAARRLSLVVVSSGYPLVGACGLLIVAASLVAGHGLSFHGLSRCGARAYCSAAHGISPDPGSHPRPLHCMQILSHWTPWGAAPAESLSPTPPGSTHKWQPLGVWRCNGIRYQGSLVCKLEQVLPPSTSKPV